MNIREFVRSARGGRMNIHNQHWFYEYYIYLYERTVQSIRFAAAEIPLGKMPIVINISFPKSGTHLLGQILKSFAHFAPLVNHGFTAFTGYDSETGRKYTEEEYLRYLHALNPGDITAVHMQAIPSVVQEICTPAYIPYFIYRDPRDVVVSHVFYVTQMRENHHLHNYYTNNLHSFEERLLTSIRGLPDAEIEFPDIACRFAFYDGWLERPEVLKIQFEGLIENRTAVLEQILNHFLARVPIKNASTSALIPILEQGIDPKRSRTFRSGKTGEWEKHFTPEIKNAFKDVAGDLLVRLGYEKDNNW